MTGGIAQCVAYADTDAGGVVYHGRYVELAERSRALWMRQAGCAFEAMPAAFGVQLVVQKLSARYHRPARLGDELHVSTTLLAIGEARGRWRTDIHRERQAVCTLVTDLAAVAINGRGLVKIPAHMLDRLQPLCQAAPAHPPRSLVSH